ncbi:hypothetical protein AAG570_009029 [Ranatra chinensis]|uniref:4-coumarate--CoA ligase n=1 Tax=Ranatra chinensis TaxID=642074 RepID=A0ABD0ZDT0_9HEMI
MKVVVAPSALTGHDPGENLPPGVVSLSSLLNEHVDPRQQFGVESRLASSVHVDASQDVAVLPYSSGTTGLPKGVCLTHHNIVSNLMQLAEPKIRNQLPTTDGHQEVVLALLPMFHIYGMVAVALQAISYGSKLVTLPKFEEKLFLKSLVEHEVTVLYLAPPLVLYLGSSPNVTKEHLKSVRVTVSGAAPIGRSDIIRCLDKSRQGNIYKQGFGLTECSPAVCCCLNNSTNYASVGPPLANTLVKVVDLTTGRSLPPNSKGEICVKGPQVMKGYLNNEVATKEAIDDQGWFHTGDIGYYDEQHLFYVVDRLKELIKVKGFQVAPAELEELLRSHAGVDDAGVIGVKDDRKGEHPVAFIKPSSISSPSEWRDLEASLRAFLKEKAADYKQIHEFVQIKMIPKSPAGKIMRKTLKEMYTPPK